MRRFACIVVLAFMITMMTAPAEAAPDAGSRLYPYGTIDAYGLQDANGKRVTEPIFNEMPFKISWDEGPARYIAAESPHRLMLLDENGKRLCEPIYDGLMEMPGTRLLLGLDSTSNTYVVVNDYGHRLFEIQGAYQHIQPGLEGQFIAYDGKNYFLLDKSGEKISRGFSEIWLMRDGATAYTCADGSIRKRGVLSLEGEVVVPCEYIVACQRNGYTIVQKHKGDMGLIDEKGKFVINPECSDIEFVTYNGSDYIQVSYRIEVDENDSYTVSELRSWDLRKFTEYPFDSVYMRENYYTGETVPMSRSYVRDSQGLPIINSEADNINPNKWIETPLDEHGFGLPFFGSDVTPLGDGFFIVSEDDDNNRAIVNSAGEVVASYPMMEMTIDGFVIYSEKIAGPYGLLRSDGTVLIEPKYSNIDYMSMGGDQLLLGRLPTREVILLPPDAAELEVSNTLDYLWD